MVKHKTILCLFLLCLHQCFSKKYSNYTLYRGVPVNEQHLSYFQNLSTRYEVNFWREPGLLNKPVEFIISPNDQPALLNDAIVYSLYLNTIIEDVQQAFDQQTVKSYIRRRTDTFDWQNYFRIDDIYNWLKDLANVYPRVMKINSIGKTFEDRDIMSVTINLGGFENGARYNPSTIKKVFIEGGIHAREWVSTAFVTYFINAILHAPNSEDQNLKTIAYLYEWYFVPVLNPDGYEYTHTQDRMWRKNRGKGFNDGVDINRNFGYRFGTEGVSFSSNSEIYCGPEAFSEKESKSMASFVEANSENLEFYFGFHAYGQFIIIPYADSKGHSENFDEVKRMATLASTKIKSKYGTYYTVGTAFDTVGYLTSGISGDWVKNTFKTPVVATFELRDGGQHGFALPPWQILPTCEETMDGMISFLTPHMGGWDDLMKRREQLSV